MKTLIINLKKTPLMQIHCLCEAFMILFAKMWLTKGIYRFDARYMLPPPSSLKCNNEKKIIFSPLKSIFFQERNYVVAVVITEKKSVI